LVKKRDILGLIKALSYQPKSDRSNNAYSIQRRAAEALCSFKKEETVDLLITSISNIETQKAIIDILGEIGDPKAVMAIASFAHNDREEIRQSALHALGKIGGTKAFESILNAAIKETNQALFESALAILSKNQQTILFKLQEAVKDPAIETSVRSMKMLQAINPKMANALLHEVFEANPQRAIVFLTTLKFNSDSLTDYFIRHLKDPDETLRCSAAQALGILNQSSAIDPLVSCITDPSVDMRLNCVKALGNFKDEKLLKILVDLKEQDASEVVRLEAEKQVDAFRNRLAASLIEQLKIQKVVDEWRKEVDHYEFSCSVRDDYVWCPQPDSAPSDREHRLKVLRDLCELGGSDAYKAICSTGESDHDEALRVAAQQKIKHWSSKRSTA
jgi:HEAT repeat protein